MAANTERYDPDFWIRETSIGNVKVSLSRFDSLCLYATVGAWQTALTRLPVKSATGIRYLWECSHCMFVFGLRLALHPISQFHVRTKVVGIDDLQQLDGCRKAGAVTTLSGARLPQQYFGLCTLSTNLAISLIL